MMSGEESGMVSIRLRGCPRLKRCLARKWEFVSITLPLRTSSPIIRQAADWYRRPFGESLGLQVGDMAPFKYQKECGEDERTERIAGVVGRKTGAVICVI